MENLVMKEMPLSERPYELLEAYGPEKLTDAQLLAVLLQSGTVGETSVEMASRLLNASDIPGRDPMVNLFAMSLSKLREQRGVGRVKSIQIKAMGELVRRLSHKEAGQKKHIGCPKDVADMYMEEMRYLHHEMAQVVFLSTKADIVGELFLGTGTLTQALVDPRMIFLKGFETGALQFILLHNHPSGDPKPSETDCHLTKRLAQMGDIMEMALADHIVIGDGTYFSFAEENKI